MKFKEKLLVYIWNKSSQLEKEYEDTRNYQRYRPLDENDYLESIIQKVRKDTFNEFVSDIMTIFKLDHLAQGTAKKPSMKK